MSFYGIVDTDQTHKNPCPEETSFAQFRDKNLPLKVSDKISKKVLKEGTGPSEVSLERSEVFYEYSMFLEGQEDPFSSSANEFGKVNAAEGLVPQRGIFMALASMKLGEEALFWISSEVMFRKFGKYGELCVKYLLQVLFKFKSFEKRFILKFLNCFDIF